MRLDRFTATAGVITLAAGLAAAWQWTAAPPPAPDSTAPPLVLMAPEPAAVSAALAQLAPVVRDSAPTPPTEPQRALRLIGVMETDQGRVAVILADDRTIFLRPGQSAAGLELISLDSALAVVATSSGERRLSLGG